MSAAHWTVVMCDSCDATFTADGGYVALTFGEARIRAKGQGWWDRAGRDICPRCSASKRGADTGGSS